VVLGPTFGILSDRWGRRPVLMIGAFGTAAMVIPVVVLMWNPDTDWKIFLAQFLVVIPFSALIGPLTAPLLEQLPQNLRGVGYGFVWACAMAIFGGTGLMISTWLAARGVNYLMSIYFIAMLVFAGFLVFRMRETAFEPMRGE